MGLLQEIQGVGVVVEVLASRGVRGYRAVDCGIEANGLLGRMPDARPWASLGIPEKEMIDLV